MKQFRYTAVDSAGKQSSGRVEASDESEVYAIVKRDGLYCTGVAELPSEGASGASYRMKVRELSLFCRQMGAMLSAGLTIVKALDILYRKTSGRKAKALLLALGEDIRKGLSFHEALQNRGGAFPDLLVRMAQAGEMSGTLDRVMSDMAVHYEKEYKLSNRVSTALAYPILLMVVTLAVVVFLFVFVLPSFFTLFGDTQLPAITRALMAVSSFLTRSWMWVALGILGVAALWSLLLRVPSVRLFADTVKLKAPVFGKSNRTVYASRFCSSMAVLYGSGIPMVQAMETSAAVLGNTRLEKQLGEAAEQVRMGEMLSSALEKDQIFDGMVSSMIYVGEESGTLDKTLSKLSDFYEEESGNALQKLTALLEPVMLIVMAVIIGLVLAAVMLPIYGMYTSVV